MATRKKSTKRTKQPQRAPKRRIVTPEDVASTATWQATFSIPNDVVEASLRTGENAGLLEDYFGAERYAELRHLSQEASSRRVRGGPRVLILPGILGSTLGKVRAGILPDDVRN